MIIKTDNYLAPEAVTFMDTGDTDHPVTLAIQNVPLYHSQEPSTSPEKCMLTRQMRMALSKGTTISQPSMP